MKWTCSDVLRSGAQWRVQSAPATGDSSSAVFGYGGSRLRLGYPCVAFDVDYLVNGRARCAIPGLSISGGLRVATLDAALEADALGEKYFDWTPLSEFARAQAADLRVDVSAKLWPQLQGQAWLEPFPLRLAAKHSSTRAMMFLDEEDCLAHGTPYGAVGIWSGSAASDTLATGIVFERADESPFDFVERLARYQKERDIVGARNIPDLLADENRRMTPAIAGVCRVVEIADYALGVARMTVRWDASRGTVADYFLRRFAALSTDFAHAHGLHACAATDLFEKLVQIDRTAPPGQVDIHFVSGSGVEASAHFFETDSDFEFRTEAAIHRIPLFAPLSLPATARPDDLSKIEVHPLFYAGPDDAWERAQYRWS